MIRKSRIWRIRLAFEPNRFSCEQLERACEQLQSTESRVSSELSPSQPSVATRLTAKRGER